MTVLSPRIEYLEETLDNGLRVILNPDQTQSIVAVSFRYAVGSHCEEPGLTGLAHLFEHLMFSGSPGVAAGEHLRLVQGLGGSANATTSMDWTAYYQVVPAEALELVLWLEADRLSGLSHTLTQESLDIQRDVVRNERRESIDNAPYGSARERVVEALFPIGHPYDHLPIGSMRDLELASLGDARSFFASYYAPDTAVVTVSGGFDPASALNWIKQYFSGLRPAQRKPQRRPIAPPLGPLEIRIEERTRLPARLFIGCTLPPAGSPAFPASRLAATIAARGNGSRLATRLIHERELAASVHLNLLPLAIDASLGIAQLVPRPGVGLGELEQAFNEEVAALVEHGPEQHEMDRALAYLDASWLARTDTADGKADELSWHAVVRGDAALANTALTDIHAAGLTQVRDAMRPWSGSTRHVVLCYSEGTA
ncbi:M16 family metallopeptidase [Nonomuraea sp. NPDC050536]|uniref:M16 family metallopeptidase n=1 Tax=Nonomuraea sp. NPDC050536 TaxID=3364366 RepID=UPI0037C8E957